MNVVKPLEKVLNSVSKASLGQAWANGLKKSVFSRTIAASQISSLDCGYSATLMSRRAISVRPSLFGVYTEIALRKDAPNFIEINLGNFGIKFLCLGISSCYLSPRDFSDGPIDTIQIRRNSESFTTCR